MANLLKFCLILNLTIFISACGGGGGNASTPTSVTTTALYSTAPTSLTMSAGSSQEFTIGGGTSPYTAVSSYSDVAVAGVSSARLTIGAVTSGDASIQIRDGVGALLSVPVTVTSGSTRALYSTAPASITIAAGASGAQTYQVGGGSRPYTVTSTNVGVVSTSITADTLTVTGIATGSAGFVVMDSQGSTINVSVTVPQVATLSLFTSAGAGVTVSKDSTTSYSVGGGTAPYSATSSNTSVATVSVVGSSLTVNGVSAGSASVLVRDAAGATVTIAVTVPNSTTVALYSTAPSSLTVAVASSSVYTVGGGTSPYTAVSNNTAIAKVNIVDSSLTIIGEAIGTASIEIRDSTGSTITVSLIVATPTLVVTPNSATAIISDPLIATVTGGKAPYTASVGNGLVASATIVNGNQLSVVPLQTGQTIITVLDSLNQSVAYSLTANAATPGIRLSPSALTISEGSTGSFQLKVYGATGTTTAFSSNLYLLRTSIAGDVVTVVTGSNPNRCVAGDTPVTITVLDSTRAIGTAIVTIEENSLTCTTALALDTTAPSGITLNVGSTAAYSIGGGTGSYTVTSSNTSVATAVLNGSSFSVTGIRTGSASIYVTDSLGASVTVAVTVP